MPPNQTAPNLLKIFVLLSQAKPLLTCYITEFLWLCLCRINFKRHSEELYLYLYTFIPYAVPCYVNLLCIIRPFSEKICEVNNRKCAVCRATPFTKPHYV